jgi:catalase
VPVNNNQRDVVMQSRVFNRPVNYESNRLAGGMPQQAPADPINLYRVAEDIIRQKINLTNDFKQAGEKSRSMGTIDQEHMVDNIVDSLGNSDKPIQEQMVNHFTRADSELSMCIAKRLNL